MAINETNLKFNFSIQHATRTVVLPAHFGDVFRAHLVFAVPDHGERNVRTSQRRNGQKIAQPAQELDQWDDTEGLCFLKILLHSQGTLCDFDTRIHQVLPWVKQYSGMNTYSDIQLLEVLNGVTREVHHFLFYVFSLSQIEENRYRVVFYDKILLQQTA